MFYEHLLVFSESFCKILIMVLDRLIISKFITCIMKGTKVLTLGAGREVLPHNMAFTKMLDADDIYTRPLAIRMRYTCIYACAVLLIGGRAGPFY